MAFPRTAGILLHPTSLPSRGGIGDFGPAAYSFIDALAAARQGVWQVLPLGPLGYGNSPYSSVSAFAGNPLLISLERLAERGWIDSPALSAYLESSPADGPVEYDRVFAAKMPLLFEAARNFVSSVQGKARQKFDRFCSENSWWLEDFVLFDAIRAQQKLASWNQWPPELARRDPAALANARQGLAPDLQIRSALQFAFYEQWKALRSYCLGRNIRVVGDVAIFVNYDSADVWHHPELFRLNDDLQPEVVSGVPPDFFSKTGQRWGNPLYRWDVMKAEGYAWWIERMRWATRHCDYIRLDHFRGFDQFWEIPAHDPDAVNGHWVDGPRDDLFIKLRAALGGLPFFAEDLGYITPEVHALRNRLQIPGMAVLQFGFNDEGSHMYLPHRASGKIIYTGTHDNDTTLGWFRSGASDHERRNVESYLGRPDDGVNWGFIRAAQNSVADLAIVPIQDVLGLGSEARMNTPSLHGGNWKWRLSPGQFSSEVISRLAQLVELSDRLPQLVPPLPEEDFAA
ncbi:MAG TPA: 4-alpha-glucanotransferase [Candidatus Binatia bacterium]|nr:4-alpha-glucanotransferase [Candidatus Binatia bacterium]